MAPARFEILNCVLEITDKDEIFDHIVIVTGSVSLCGEIHCEYEE